MASLRAPEKTEGAGTAIQVENLGKCFWLERPAPHRLRQILLGKSSPPDSEKQLWALRDVSFEVAPGEVFGILGRNGAGKTTLLQILGGIIQPSCGQVAVRGRVAALLEIGSGFDPNSSGRENVFMNAALLGVERDLLEQKFDEIVEFAEIGAFLDRPVKTYSSGMFLRLAFAVSTCLTPDVLLIDETLAVGDVFFRQKCYRRLEELKRGGTAVILVSHSPGEVEQLCERALLLDEGNPVFLGPAPATVKRYYLQAFPSPAEGVGSGSEGSTIQQQHLGGSLGWPEEAGNLLDACRDDLLGMALCRRFSICDEAGNSCLSFQQGQVAMFLAEFEILRDVDVPTAGVELQNQRGVIVHGKSTLEHDSRVPTHITAGSILRFRQEITLELEIGEYSVNLGLGALTATDYLMRGDLSHGELDSRLTRLCLLPSIASLAVVWKTSGSPVQLLHHGVANLPGSCRLVVVGTETDDD